MRDVCLEWLLIDWPVVAGASESRLAFFRSCKYGICWTTTAGDLALECRLGSWLCLIDWPVVCSTIRTPGRFCWLILLEKP